MVLSGLRCGSMRQGASQANSNVPSSPLVDVSRALNPVKRSNAAEQNLAQRVRERKTVVFISSGQPEGGGIFQQILNRVPGFPTFSRTKRRMKSETLMANESRT